MDIEYVLLEQKYFIQSLSEDGLRFVQGVSGTVHERKKIEDHGYKNFVFLNHENKQVRYCF